MERSRPDRMDRVATVDYILWPFTSWTHLQLDGLGHSVGRLVLEQSAVFHFFDRVLFYFVLGLFQSSTTLLFTHFPYMGHDELNFFLSLFCLECSRLGLGSHHHILEILHLRGGQIFLLIMIVRINVLLLFKLLGEITSR